MKLRIEMSDDMPNEVVIYCKQLTPDIKRLQNAITNELSGNSMLLTLGDTEYYIPISDILFFETDGEKVAAHTKSNMYFSEQRLYELENILPRNFMRVSKSCILDFMKVSSITKNLTGSGEVLFAGTPKKTYASRMYIKSLKEHIYETRLKKG